MKHRFWENMDALLHKGVVISLIFAQFVSKLTWNKLLQYSLAKQISSS